MSFLSTIYTKAKQADHAVATIITAALESDVLKNMVRFVTLGLATQAVVGMGNPNVGGQTTLQRGIGVQLQAEEAQNVTQEYEFIVHSSTAAIINKIYITAPSCTNSSICTDIGECVNSTNTEMEIKVDDVGTKLTVSSMITTDCYSPPLVDIENDGCDYHQTECEQGVNDDVVVTSAYTNS